VVHRNLYARTDTEMLKAWLKSHQDGSAHTIRVYKWGELWALPQDQMIGHPQAS
jgi:hypothetical protein